MKKLHLTHKVFTASVVGAVTVTTSVAAVFAYQAVTQYKPSSSKEEMKNNQVLFNNNKNSLSNNSKNEQNSKWLEKQDQKNKQDATQNSNYLFDKNQEVAVQKTMTLNTQTTTSETDSSQNTKSDSSNTVTDSDTNTVVDVDKNAKNPDIIIDDKSNSTSGEDNTGKGDNSGSGTIDPALPDSNHKPSDSTGGNNTNPGGNTSGGTTTPTTKIDYDKIKDPEIKKETPIYDVVKDYKEGDVDFKQDDEDPEITIFPSFSTSIQLYSGYSISKQDIFNLFTTGIQKFDYTNFQWVFYNWGENALYSTENPDGYVKVDSISFDNGKTWIKDFPVTIPNGTKKIKVDMSYRFSKNDSWTHYEPDYESNLTLQVGDSKVYVLTKKLDENSTSIDLDSIAGSTGGQYADIGGILSLYHSQFFMVPEGENVELKQLFMGWSENGVPVDWFYEAKAGRHILEPIGYIDVDSGYTIKLVHDFPHPIYKGKDYLCYFQTLTSSEDTGILKVPKYVQMVQLDSAQTYNSVELPDTVMEIHDANINVQDKWVVSENNPYLTVNDGILMSKDLTEIVSIPQKINEVKVPKTVKKISAENLSGKTLYLDADSLDDLPEIMYAKKRTNDNGDMVAYSYLKNCKIILNDDLLEEYLVNQCINNKRDETRYGYGDIYDSENVSFAKKSDPDTIYRVKKSGIYINDNVLYKATSSNSNFKLSKNVNLIKKDAFSVADNVTSFYLPKAGGLVTFEEGCFDNSSINKIYCYTEKQKESVEKQLKDLGLDQQIEIVMVGTTVNGYEYVVDDGKTILIDAPSDITEFDGNIGNGIQVDALGDDLFKDCTQLKYVYLPESIKEIGEDCFKNCSNLELMLIDSKDKISIGYGAFDGLNSIRMIASNATNANMGNYSPSLYNMAYQLVFFAPSTINGNSGYNNALYFDGDYGYYTMENIGANAKAIYMKDVEDNPFLMLASQKVVDKNVTLPSTTTQIYDYAMANTCSGSDLDPYTINLGSLSDVTYESGAFYNSNISGDVTIGENSYVKSSVFEYCQFIDSVTALDNVSFESYAFSNCDSITKYKSINTDDLSENTFAWCAGMNEIEFVGKIPDITGMPVSGSGPIHITLTDTSYTEEVFLQKYLYIFAGYTDSDGVTASKAMWNDVQDDIMNAHWGDAEFVLKYDDVYAAFKIKLLEAENTLRTMLGMDSVTEPTWMPTDIPTKKDFGEEDEEDKKTEDKKDDSESPDKDIEESEDTEESKDDSDENQSGESNGSEVETPTEQEIPNTDDVGDDSITPDVQSDTTQIQDIQENEEDFQ